MGAWPESNPPECVHRIEGRTLAQLHHSAEIAIRVNSRQFPVDQALSRIPHFATRLTAIAPHGRVSRVGQTNIACETVELLRYRDQIGVAKWE